MASKRLKRTDQEWFDLIQDCRTSGLKINSWCEQHGITLKALYYHTRRLQQKGYSIPRRVISATPKQRQDIIQLDIQGNRSVGSSGEPALALETSIAAVRIDFHGIFLEISTHQETVKMPSTHFCLVCGLPCFPL